MILSEFTSALIQLLAFTSIPFIVFLITKKTYKGFFQYIGLYKPNRKSVYAAIGVSLLFVAMGLSFALWSPEIKAMMLAPGTVVGKLRESGSTVQTIIILLIVS